MSMRGKPWAFRCCLIATGRSLLEPHASRDDADARRAMSDAAGRVEREAVTAPLVVELVTEELPPKALKTLDAAFAETLAAELRKRDLLSATSAATSFATPRRLAVLITQVRDVAPDSEVVTKLMPAKVAFDERKQPTPALQKKLASLGRPNLATPGLDAWDGPD